MDINGTVLVASKGKETEDMDKECSKERAERWDRFLKNLESNGYVEYYRKWLEAVKEKRRDGTIDAEGLATKEYEAWTEDEDKKMCWLETVKILKVCNQEELTYSNPYVVQELYRERLISNGFVEEEKAVVLAIERETDNDATAAARVCDTPDAESKGIADNIIARRRSMQKEHIRELLMAKQKKQRNCR